jgi:TRAP-type C4-dicarboxylate transport system permease small subunit
MKRLIKIEKSIAITFLLISGTFGLFNIFARYLFGLGWPWSDGIVVMFTIWGSLIASAIVIEQKGHIVIDVIIAKLKPPYHKIAVFVSNLITTTFLTILFLLSLNQLKFLLSFGGTSLQTYLPAWIEFIGVPFSLFLMVLHSTHRTIVSIRGVE